MERYGERGDQGKCADQRTILELKSLKLRLYGQEPCLAGTINFPVDSLSSKFHFKKIVDHVYVLN